MISEIIFFSLVAALVIMAVTLPMLIVRRNRRSQGGEWDGDRLEIGQIRQENSVKYDRNPPPGPRGP